MKKIVFSMLLVATLLMLGVSPLMAAPAFNPNFSISGVEGSVSQTDAAITTSSKDTSQGGAFGTQTTSASFTGFAISPDGEDASGSASTAGGVTVSSFSTKDGATSLAIGNTTGSSSIGVTADSGNITFATIAGNGSLQLGTYALTGSSTLNPYDGTITLGGNGAFAVSSVSGGYNYLAISGPNGYTGWTGSGSITGSSDSTVTKIPGGYSSSSSASVTSVACPVK
jgi:hypothetical protein